MPKFRVLVKVTQLENWYVKAESEQAAKDGVFEVDDTEMLEGVGDPEIIGVDDFSD